MKRNRRLLGVLFIALVAAGAQVARAEGPCCVNGDCQGNHTPLTCPGVFQGPDTVIDAGGLGLPIWDSTSVSHTLNMPQSYVLQDVDIGLQITHTFVGDLVIEVEHLGTTVTLVDRPSGCSEDNYNIILDDEGSGGAIQAQCSPDLSSPPNYTPNNPLSAFDGMDSAGDWTIIVHDQVPFDTGTLDGWSVHLGGPTEVCEPDDDPTDNLCAVVFVPRDISVNADGASSVFAVDLDADGDVDVLSASADDNTIAWYENDGGSPPLFTKHVISTSALGAGSVFAVDVDNDGDVDVLSASKDDNKIAWYESDGGSPPTFAAHVITGRALAAAALGLFIPDDGFPGSGVSHTRNVSESFILSDVDIGVQITHTYVGDLVIQVEHLGTTVTLVDRPPACNENNYDIILDDEGLGGPIQSQCSPDLSSPPNYTPNNPLSAFDGMDSAGDWTITVFDAASIDTGTLDGWSVHINQGFADNAASVFAADVDGDGDMDILSASSADDRCSNNPLLECSDPSDCGGATCNLAKALVWYENDGNSPPGFTPRPIPRDRFGKDARFVLAVDLDGDTDIDVLASSGGDAPEDIRAVAWYENDGAAIPGFTEHVVQSTAGANIFSVSAADIDRDGQRDIVSASRTDEAIAWYENDGGLPPVFAQQSVSGGALPHFSVFAADVDGDGDSDIVSGSADSVQSWIGWYENRGGSPQRFSPRTRRISNNVVDARAVFAADVDGDGDIDVLSASAGDDRIAWYENQNAPDVFNVTTVRLFNTVASAIANAADRDSLSAHPDRFDDAEPEIDFRGKAITLQARGAITQPLGGIYTLADDSVLRTAPGNWNMTLQGALVAPAGAHADLFAASFSLLGAGSSLTADPNAALALAADVTIDGAVDLALGSTLTTPGTLDLTSSSILTADGGEIIAAGGLTIAGDVTLSLGSALRTNGALTAVAGSVLTMSGSDLLADGTVTLKGIVNLDTGSVIHAGDLLTLATNGTLAATGADLLTAGDAKIEGKVELSLGSSLTVGGLLEVFEDDPLTTLTVGAGSGLFVTGDVILSRPVRLDVGSSLSSGGALEITPINGLPDGTDALTADANASVSAGGAVTIASPVRLSVGSVLSSKDEIVNSSDMRFFGAGISALNTFTNNGFLTGFGTIDAHFVNDTLAKALFRADTEVVGDYTNGAQFGECDDAEPAAAGVACTSDADCGVGICEELFECDANSPNPDQPCTADTDCEPGGTCEARDKCDANSAGGLADQPCTDDDDCRIGTCLFVVTCDDAEPDVAGVPCTSDADCGVGICEEVQECDATSPNPDQPCTADTDCEPGGTCEVRDKCDANSAGGLAGQPCATDDDCRIGTCLMAVTEVEDNSTLVILGTLTNHGRMSGTIQPPPPTTGADGGTASPRVEWGFVVRGDLIAASTASLLLPLPQSVVQVGGSYDTAVNDNRRIDLAQVELRMIGPGDEVQEVEVMSTDIGPVPSGLDHTRTAHFPIGTFRIGPTATTVRLVDKHDNDGLGQNLPEAIYVRSLVVESGATLITNNRKVYYATLTLNGNVDDLDNLIEIVSLPQDFDRDFDVDLNDYTLLVHCVGGPNSDDPAGTCTAAQFEMADLDNDNDVDLLDIRLFLSSFTGE